MPFVDIEEVQELYTEQSMKIQSLMSQLKERDDEIAELKERLSELESE